MIDLVENIANIMLSLILIVLIQNKLSIVH